MSLYEEIPVLEHGFVRLVRCMGDDDAIVQAARVSYGSGTKTVSEDAKLIDYLIKNRHTSPLESVVLVFHMKLPIFVARQFVRHRTARISEVSARYSTMEEEFHCPGMEIPVHPEQAVLGESSLKTHKTSPRHTV